MQEVSGAWEHIKTPFRTDYISRLPNTIHHMENRPHRGPAPGGLRYCVVAVDYFFKWIEAEPLATIIANQIRKFVWKIIVCRFGCPRVIVADNETQFMDTGFQT